MVRINMGTEFNMEVVCLDITNRCNFRCKHCYNFSGEQVRSSKELTDNEVLSLVQEICEFQPNTICLCGGEPLLRVELIYKILDLVKLKRQNGLPNVNMVTNGYYMTEEIARTLKEKEIAFVQISLDGFNPETHNWIRNNDNAYEKAINAIKILNQNNIFTGVACAPSTKNFSEIHDLMNLCYSLNVKLLRFQPLMIMGRGHNMEEYSLNKANYFKLSQLIKNSQKEFPNMELEWGDPLHHLRIFSNKDTNKFTHFNISSYGDILFSPYIPVSVGNIRRHTLKEYFENGIEDILKDTNIKKLCSLILDWKSMQLNDINKEFPIIGLNDNIQYDIIDKSSADEEKLKNIVNGGNINE